VWRKVRHGRIWRRIFIERLTEPVHLNVLSLLVAVVGTFRAKVAFDLVLRHHHAYSLLRQADMARKTGVRRVTAIECGVASGAGLINLARIAQKVTRATGVEFDVYGFDTGTGMPPPRDYRDHPEHYAAGNFTMDPDRIRQMLPPNAHLILGELGETVPGFVAGLQAPIAFISLDVDYYWSARDALALCDGPPESYLPTTIVYADDIAFQSHSRWAGEQLAIREYNEEHELRKIERYDALADTRIFKRAAWLRHIYTLQVLDHPLRQPAETYGSRTLENPYLKR
jgi:hypothetical protein